MLQKSEEEHKEQSFTVLLLCLDGHSEQLCNERRLSHAISFAHSLHLPFPHHVDCFISLQGSPSCLKRKETHSRFHQSFDEAAVQTAELMESLQNKVGEDFIVRKKEEITPHLMRILANGVINETYRYGPIEGIHDGSYLPDSSVPSRISLFAEQEVLTTTAQRLIPIVHALYRIITKKTGETLEEKIIPYVFRFVLANMIFPSTWSLTEDTRIIRLFIHKQ